MIGRYDYKWFRPRWYFTETMVNRLLELDRNAAKRLRMDMLIKDMPDLKTLNSEEKKKEAAAKSKGKTKGEKR